MNGSKHYLLNLNIITSHAKALYTNTFDTISIPISISSSYILAKYWNSTIVRISYITFRSNRAIGVFVYRLLINTIYIMQTDLTTSYPCHGMYPSYPFDTFHVTSWHQLKYEYFIRWPPLIALIIFIFYLSCHHSDHQKNSARKRLCHTWDKEFITRVNITVFLWRQVSLFDEMPSHIITHFQNIATSTFCLI